MKVNWTKDRPKAEGWYWWHDDELVTRLQYVKRVEGVLLTVVGGCAVPVEKYGTGYWAEAELPEPPEVL